VDPAAMDIKITDPATTDPSTMGFARTDSTTMDPASIDPGQWTLQQKISQE